MAALSDLVSTLAYVTWVPDATVFAYGRFAREAGFISQKGRGRGAATMTTRDAANLLIAVMGTEITREAGKVINTYGALTGWTDEPVGRGGQVLVNWLSPLGMKQRAGAYSLNFTFGDFLEFLIDAARSDQIGPLLRSIEIVDRTPEDDAFARQHPNADIETLLDLGARRLDPRSVIVGRDINLRVLFDRFNFKALVEFSRFRQGMPERLWNLNFETDPMSGADLRIKAEVGLATISALGWCLAGRKLARHLEDPQEFIDFIFNQKDPAGFQASEKDDGEHH